MLLFVRLRIGLTQFSIEALNRIPVIPAKAGIQTPVAN